MGATPEDMKTISEPINGKVFFAGEHTNFDFIGTAHTAYLSGERASQEILDSFNVK